VKNHTKTYSDKLKDPRWQKKRLEVLEMSEWACEICQDKDSTLHVHHHQYLKGREPWEYDHSQFSVLCESCHQEEHDKDDILMDVVSRLKLDRMKWIDREKAAYLIAGALGLEDLNLQNNEQKSWFYAGLHIQKTVDDFYHDFTEDSNGAD